MIAGANIELFCQLFHEIGTHHTFGQNDLEQMPVAVFRVGDRQLLTAFFFEVIAKAGEVMLRQTAPVRGNRIDIRQLAANDEIELCPNGPKMRFIGEGRLAEIDTVAEQPVLKGYFQDDVAPNSPAAPQHDSLLSKLARGFRK